MLLIPSALFFAAWAVSLAAPARRSLVLWARTLRHPACRISAPFVVSSQVQANRALMAAGAGRNPFGISPPGRCVHVWSQGRECLLVSPWRQVLRASPKGQSCYRLF